MSADRLLTDDELIQLVGTDNKGSQKRWLKKNGVRHRIRIDGRPVTTLSAVNMALYGSAPAANDDGFNLEAI